VEIALSGDTERWSQNSDVEWPRNAHNFGETHTILGKFVAITNMNAEAKFMLRRQPE